VQMPRFPDQLAHALKLPGSAVRVYNDVDVGGSYGVKRGIKHAVIVGYLSRRLGFPVRLIEDRHENMRAGDAHGPERNFDIEVAFDDAGVIRSMKMRALDNVGAYAGRSPFQLGKPVSYGAVILSLQRMREHDLMPAKREERHRGMIRDGVRYTLARPDLMLILTIVFFAGTFGLNFQLTSALMATEVFHKGAGEYGILGTTLAIGSLSGALLAARRTRIRHRLVILAALSFGAAEIVAGLLPSYLAFAVWTPVLGLASLTMITSANASFQLSVDPAMRGRAMALYLMVFMGGTPIGSPIVGWVGQTFGARWTLVGGGAATLVGTLLAVVVFSRAQGLIGHRARTTEDAPVRSDTSVARSAA
jgi:hypothetical protein